MSLDSPIIILACPRSGSSMTAGLFHLHGVWVGTSRGGNDNNPKGFFEHTHLKQLFKKMWGWDLLALSENPPQPKEDFYDKAVQIISKDGYPGGKWLFKHSALYWRAWHDFNPKFICVRRDLEQTVQSNIDVGLHRGEWKPGQLMDIMKAHHREMDLCGGVNVYTDELIEGKYDSLYNALEYCGLTPDVEKIEDFIEPRYWKHAGTSPRS